MVNTQAVMVTSYLVSIFFLVRTSIFVFLPGNQHIFNGSYSVVMSCVCLSLHLCVFLFVYMWICVYMCQGSCVNNIYMIQSTPETGMNNFIFLRGSKSSDYSYTAVITNYNIVNEMIIILSLFQTFNNWFNVYVLRRYSSRLSYV